MLNAPRLIRSIAVLGRRLACLLLGHDSRFEEAGWAGSAISTYRCRRCEKETSLG